MSHNFITRKGGVCLLRHSDSIGTKDGDQKRAILGITLLAAEGWVELGLAGTCRVDRKGRSKKANGLSGSPLRLANTVERERVAEEGGNRPYEPCHSVGTLGSTFYGDPNPILLSSKNDKARRRIGKALPSEA